MTDNEIIKALELCVNKLDVFVSYCDAEGKTHKITIKDIVDILNRLKTENKKNENIIRLADKTIATQNAEIERLQSRNNFLEIEYKNQGNLFWERVESAKSEAIKEFAERLKAISHPYGDTQMVFELQIDNLVKEMVGE